jgi:hypothetical protein
MSAELLSLYGSRLVVSRDGVPVIAPGLGEFSGTRHLTVDVLEVEVFAFKSPNSASFE